VSTDALMSEPREYVTPGWDQIYEMLVDTAIKIKQSGFSPDLIVGVSRGGWTPGRVLSDLLANSHTASVKIEFYVGIDKTASKPVVTQPISENVSKKRILIVDDVADTGESLTVALDHVRELGADEVKTATIYHKPHSIFKPDFFAESTSKWIIFPWERLEATKLLIHEAKAEGRDMESVRQILRQCKIDDKTIEALFRLANGGT